MSKRSFSPSNTPEKAIDYHGACGFVRLSPDVAKQGVKSLNVDVTFEEALKLRMALESCLLAINRYNRSTKQGRSMGLCLSLKMDSQSVAVIEVPLRPARTQTAE